MRILILGLGSAGTRHLKNLLALGETDIWVYDPDLARTEALAPYARVMTEPPTMITAYGAAVLVCTPPATHAEWAQRAIDCSVDHVFIEKPIGTDLAEANALVETAAKYRTVLSVGYQLRFHRGLQETKRCFGEIGSPIRIDATFSQPLPDWRPGTDYRQNYLMTLEGGIILEQSHEIDYCRWLAGEVEAVECKARNTGEYGLQSYDTADIVLYHKSGTESHIHLDCTGAAIPEGYRQASRTPNYMRYCSIHGTEGDIHWNYNGRLLIRTPERCIERAAFAGFDMGARTYQDEMRHFLRCCKKEATPPVDGVEGARVLSICLAAVESARQEGKRVEV